MKKDDYSLKINKGKSIFLKGSISFNGYSSLKEVVDLQ
jgi:hypothetical protein